MRKNPKDAGTSAKANPVGRRGASGPPSSLGRLSHAIATAEGIGAGLCVAVIFGLLLANVVSRGLGKPLIWTDELAVFLMVWAAFLGASLGIARRQHIAITLLPDMAGASTRRALALAVDVALLVFLLALSAQIWRWFDPITLWRSASAEAFSLATFNFIYQEPTVTLGMRKMWFWLVLPLFCVTATIHVLASLAGRLSGGDLAGDGGEART